MSSSHAQETTHIESLQALRGFAAVSVMLFHGTGMMWNMWGYDYLSWSFAGGFSGVDLFFVLSGFIIYYTNRIRPTTPAEFLLKRFIRLYPVYWVVILILLVEHYLFPSPNQAYKNDPFLVLNAFLLVPQVQGLVHAAWTLSYEVMFYLLFALFHFCGRKYFWVWFLAWIGFLFFRTDLLPEVFKSLIHSDFVIPIFSEFLLGCFVAELYLKNIKWASRVSLVVGIIAFFVSWTFYHHTRWGLAFGLPAACIIYGLVNVRPAIPEWLLQLGNASYSLYLVHGPALSLALRATDFLGLVDYVAHPAGATFMFALVALAGWLFYRLVENPLLVFLRHWLLLPVTSRAQ